MQCCMVDNDTYLNCNMALSLKKNYLYVYYLHDFLSVMLGSTNVCDDKLNTTVLQFTSQSQIQPQPVV